MTKTDAAKKSLGMSNEDYYLAFKPSNSTVRPSYIAVYKPDGAETPDDERLVLCRKKSARSRKVYLRPFSDIVTPQGHIYAQDWTPMFFKTANRAELAIQFVMNYQFWNPS